MDLSFEFKLAQQRERVEKARDLLEQTADPDSRALLSSFAQECERRLREIEAGPTDSDSLLS